MLADVVGLVDAARRGAVRSVNAIMTATYGAIGRRIVEQEQRGAAKAGYADAGQMHLYLNYAREHWTLPGENPPIGLILCAQKDHAVARRGSRPKPTSDA